MDRIKEMTVKEIIEQRRAYRSLDPIEISKDTIHEVCQAAQLAPSCFNNQPWHFVVVVTPERVKGMHDALSQGNKWAYDASLFIAVCARKSDDCVIYDREYYLFDTGLATAFLILRATELGLVAHPIAGYSPKTARKILSIPEEMQVIALIVVGKHAKRIKPVLSEKQREQEVHRPTRKPLSSFIHYDQFKEVKTNE
jgi:nitroreductase